VGLEHRDIDREGGHPRAERNMLRQGDEGYGSTER
jgi:hypothetical protein